MITERGKSVYKGVAIGKISVHKSGEQPVKRVHVENTEAEKEFCVIYMLITRFSGIFHQIAGLAVQEET